MPTPPPKQQYNPQLDTPSLSHLSHEEKCIAVQGYVIIDILSLKEKIESISLVEIDAVFNKMKSVLQLFQEINVHNKTDVGDKCRFKLSLDHPEFPPVSRSHIRELLKLILNAIPTLTSERSLNNPSVLKSLPGTQQQDAHCDYYGTIKEYSKIATKPNLSCIFPLLEDCSIIVTINTFYLYT